MDARPMPDVALGLVISSARLGRATGRLALQPAQLAVRVPVVGARLERAVDALAGDGRDAIADGRRRLEDLWCEVLTAPEVERAADRVLAGPLTDAVARSVAEHRVVERVAVQVLDIVDTDRIVDAVLSDPRMESLAIRVLESRLVDAVTDRVLASPELQRVVEHIAESPEVRAAVTQHTEGLAAEVVSDVRQRSESADDVVERRVRGWLHRPRPDGP